MRERPRGRGGQCKHALPGGWGQVKKMPRSVCMGEEEAQGDGCG